MAEAEREDIRESALGSVTFADPGGVLDEPYPAVVGHASGVTKWLGSSGLCDPESTCRDPHPDGVRVWVLPRAVICELWLT
jgi:hypothetical protein